MLIKVFSVLSMFLKLSTFIHGCVGEGGGGATGFLFSSSSYLVAKQAVEFPQVLASLLIIINIQ